MESCTKGQPCGYWHLSLGVYDADDIAYFNNGTIASSKILKDMSMEPARWPHDEGLRNPGWVL